MTDCHTALQGRGNRFGGTVPDSYGRVQAHDHLRGHSHTMARGHTTKVYHEQSSHHDIDRGVFENRVPGETYVRQRAPVRQ